MEKRSLTFRGNLATTAFFILPGTYLCGFSRRKFIALFTNFFVFWTERNKEPFKSLRIVKIFAMKESTT